MSFHKTWINGSIQMDLVYNLGTEKKYKKFKFMFRRWTNFYGFGTTWGWLIDDRIFIFAQRWKFTQRWKLCHLWGSKHGMNLFLLWRSIFVQTMKVNWVQNNIPIGPNWLSLYGQINTGAFKKIYIFCPFKAPESYKQKHFLNSLFQSPKLTYIHTRYAVAWELSPAEAFSSSISPEPLFHTLLFSSGFCDLCRLPVISCYLCRSL